MIIRESTRLVSARRQFRDGLDQHRLLNMYQFHKVPSVQRDSKDVCFEHPHFQRGRDDLLPLVQRKGAQSMRDELMALTQRLFRTFPNFKLRRRRLHMRPHRLDDAFMIT